MTKFQVLVEIDDRNGDDDVVEMTVEVEAEHDGAAMTAAENLLSEAGYSVLGAIATQVIE